MWIEVFQTMERHILTLSYSALDVDEQMAFSWVHNSIVDVAKEAGVSIR
jgi:hypothetical protein